ncbi:hypothetical protein GGR56DRAFT_693990 [Xylariaceae sp. FL0804]|nr:hypothetical protein GGR56DRAFT_693990 [Xylariaceae sp. FL0804]
MKTFNVAAILAPSVASAQWYNGAPECAQSCLSSAFAPSGTISTVWPAQSEYCDADKGNSVGACINNACSVTKTAFSSYSALSSSLCSRYASCTAAGSTGVETITYPGGPVTWAAPGGWGEKFPGGIPGGNNNGFGGGAPGGAGSSGWGGPNGTEASAYWSEWASAASASKTWSGGVVTVTGCAFDGSPWFVGPECGWNGEGGFNGWVGWGAGWSWGPTSTVTAAYTTTNSAGAFVTETGAVTVAQAVSGTLTTESTLRVAEATNAGSGSNSAGVSVRAPGAEGSIVTVLMGVAFGAVIIVAGML